MATTRKKMALVIGSARTIGAASTGKLAERNFHVIVDDRDIAGARQVAAELPGQRHSAICLDVCDEASVAAAFDSAESHLDEIDVLISCVGGPVTKRSKPPRLADLSLEDWDDTYDLNARSTFLVLRQMLRSRHRRPLPDARIVTIGSIGGQVAWSATGGHYTSSKATVLSLTRYAAIEAAPSGMTVNSIAPGVIDGPGFRSTLTSEEIDRLVATTPISRLGTSDEVAATVAWLVSQDAGYITGATIDVNGGRRVA